jgi:hypothetical protein
MTGISGMILDPRDSVRDQYFATICLYGRTGSAAKRWLPKSNSNPCNFARPQLDGS